MENRIVEELQKELNQIKDAKEYSVQFASQLEDSEIVKVKKNVPNLYADGCHVEKVPAKRER